MRRTAPHSPTKQSLASRAYAVIMAVLLVMNVTVTSAFSADDATAAPLSATSAAQTETSGQDEPAASSDESPAEGAGDLPADAHDAAVDPDNPSGPIAPAAPETSLEPTPQPAPDDAASPNVADANAPPAARAADITDLVSIDGIKLQQKQGDGTWRDVPAGAQLTSGAYVRVYIDWSIPNMDPVNPNDTFTITINGDNHLLATDHGAINLVDPSTSTVIGSYEVHGNRADNGGIEPGKPITIVTTISEAGSLYTSFENGFFSLEGYVRGAGSDITFTVNGEALPSINIETPSTGPLPGEKLIKYGSQVAGQNQIVWNMAVNLDNVVNSYAGYAAGNPQASPQQRNLLLTDDLQGGQVVSSQDVVVYLPILATTDDGAAQTEQLATQPLSELFDHVDAGAASGKTQSQFADEVRFAANPTIGVWEGHVVYIGFGNVPDNGTSKLNLRNVLDGHGEEALDLLLDQRVPSQAQRDIIKNYLGTSGANKGDLTSFIVEMRTEASETGRYANTATLTFGDSSTEQASGGASFTVISGGVEVRDGKAVLTKTDADSGALLPNAVFALEKMQVDNTWAAVAGSERLVTAADGTIAVTGLLLGQYRFVEVEPPAGYQLATDAFEFVISSSTPNRTATVAAENHKAPVLGSATLTKVDADDHAAVLEGAVFALEAHAADGTWQTVAGFDQLATDEDGRISVTDLPQGQYRFMETAAPDGYVLDGEPIPFEIDGINAAPVALTAENALISPDPVDPIDPPDPVDPTDPPDPIDPTDPQPPTDPAQPNMPQTPSAGNPTSQPQASTASHASATPRTGDTPLAVVAAVVAGAAATALAATAVHRRRARKSE